MKNQKRSWFKVFILMFVCFFSLGFVACTTSCKSKTGNVDPSKDQIVWDARKAWAESGFQGTFEEFLQTMANISNIYINQEDGNLMFVMGDGSIFNAGKITGDNGVGIRSISSEIADRWGLKIKTTYTFDNGTTNSTTYFTGLTYGRVYDAKTFEELDYLLENGVENIAITRNLEDSEYEFTLDEGFDSDFKLDLTGKTLTVKSFNLSSVGNEAEINLLNGKIKTTDGIVVSAENGTVILNNIKGYDKNGEVELNATTSSLHINGSVEFYKGFDNSATATTVTIPANTRVVIEENSNFVVEKIKVEEVEGYTQPIVLEVYGQETENISVEGDVIISGGESSRVDADGDVLIAVVELNGKPYQSLAAAVDAAVDGDKISLLQNLNISSYIEIHKDITIDFCGYKIVSTGAGFDVYSDLTLQNGTLETQSWSLWLQGDCTTVVGDEFKIDGNKSEYTDKAAIIIVEGARVDVYGEVVSAKNFTICGNGSEGLGNVTINVYDGAYIGGQSEIAVYMPNTTYLNIYGGTIVGETAVYIKSGLTTISGGTLKGTGVYKDYSYYGNGAYATGDALVIDNCGYPGGAPVAVITGGTFVSENASAVGSYASGNVSEGIARVPLTGFISGGTFSSDVSEYLVIAPQSYLLKNETTYVVYNSIEDADDDGAVALVGNVFYKTFADALLVANNKTIMLRKSVEASNVSIAAEKVVTVNLNGFVVTGTYGDNKTAFEVLGELNLVGTTENSGLKGCIIVKATGKLTVNGGTYKQTLTEGNYSAIEVDSAATAAVVEIRNAIIESICDNGSAINFAGEGTYLISKTNVSGVVGIVIDDGVLTLEGAETVVTGTLNALTIDENATVVVKEGTYSSDVRSYVDSDSYIYFNETYKVVKKQEGKQVAIGATQYASFSAALVGFKKDVVVEILCDGVTVEKNTRFIEEFVVNKNGYNFAISSEDVILGDCLYIVTTETQVKIVRHYEHEYLNGYCTVCGFKDGEATFVAAIGDDEYTTIDEALEAVGENETIKFLIDVALTHTLVLDKEYAVEIDLNNCEVSAATEFVGTSLFKVSGEKESVTFRNAGAVIANGTTTVCVEVTNAATVVVTDGNFYCGGSGACFSVDNSGVLEIRGGEFAVCEGETLTQLFILGTNKMQDCDVEPRIEIYIGTFYGNETLGYDELVKDYVVSTSTYSKVEEQYVWTVAPNEN